MIAPLSRRLLLCMLLLVGLATPIAGCAYSFEARNVSDRRIAVRIDLNKIHKGGKVLEPGGEFTWSGRSGWGVPRAYAWIVDDGGHPVPGSTTAIKLPPSRTHRVDLDAGAGEVVPRTATTAGP